MRNEYRPGTLTGIFGMPNENGISNTYGIQPVTKLVIDSARIQSIPESIFAIALPVGVRRTVNDSKSDNLTDTTLFCAEKSTLALIGSGLKL